MSYHGVGYLNCIQTHETQVTHFITSCLIRFERILHMNANGKLQILILSVRQSELRNDKEMNEY